PDLTLDVVAGQCGRGIAAMDDGVRNAPGGIRLPGVQDPIGAWPLATVVFALLWLVTLGCALQRRTHVAGAVTNIGVATRETTGPRVAQRALRDALQTGDLHAIADALCAQAQPPADGLDALAARLADPAQRDA